MKILLVEDDSDDARFLRACLDREGAQDIELIRAALMQEAIQALHGDSFDVVLLDLHLPDATGRSCVERVQHVNPEVPIVVLSGLGDEDFAVEILNSGAQDYLVKWEGDGRIILRSIRYAIERKRTESRLNYLARYDSLTAVPNRQYFQDQLEQATRRARRGGKQLGLLFIDLDRFKSINDTLGHQVGDRLLCAVVNRLKSSVRSGDILARLGGDEFVVLVEDVRGPLELEAVAKNILTVFDNPFNLGDRHVSITASIGISLYPADNNDPLVLLNNADIAMYQAKESNRNSFKFFTRSMHEEIMRFHQLESDLRRALDQGELELVYQPQICLQDRKIRSMEALLRWNHPERGVVAPNEFISVAEESGLIVPIGMWVLDRACRQLGAWRETGLPLPRIAVNVTPTHFHQPDFPSFVKRTLAEYSISPELIELELTESSLMEDSLNVQHCLRELKAVGVRISVDDFGTGYSCLSYLKMFPIDVLKIDRAFVADIGDSEDSQAICGAILSIAKCLSMETVAEGVETESQLNFLVGRGCELAQGHYFSEAVKPEWIQEAMIGHADQYGSALDGDGGVAIAREVMQ